MKAPGVRPHAFSSFRVAGSNLSASAMKPTWATSKIGAVGSVLMATISPASFMPATCCIAPLMPQATYNLGRTVFPLCPTCRVFGSQSKSVRGREAPTTPPIAFANSSTKARFSFFWIPRPAETMMSAVDRSMSWTCGRSSRTNVSRIEDVERGAGEVGRDLPNAVAEHRDPSVALVPEGPRERARRGDQFQRGRRDPPFEMFRDDQDSAGHRSPPHEAFLPQQLGEPFRLLFDRTGDHLRMALGRGRREAADPEGIRQRDGLPIGETEGRGAQLLDRLPRRLHDRRERRVSRVFAPNWIDRRAGNGSVYTRWSPPSSSHATSTRLPWTATRVTTLAWARPRNPAKRPPVAEFT